MHYPSKITADSLAKHGRYGDTMLVHMNPIEVQGIAAMSPTGKLTTNPETGQPEAFLPFLLPMLGSWLGTSALTGMGAAAGLFGGAGLSAGMAGAIGSGLATTAITGDLKKGIAAGLTGYGIGKMLGGAAEDVSTEVGNASTLLSGATNDANTSIQALGAAGQKIPQSGTGLQAAIANSKSVSAAPKEVMSYMNARNNLRMAQQGMDAAKAGITRMDRLRAPMNMSGMMQGLKQPGVMLPIATGMGQYAQLEQNESLRDIARGRERDKASKLKDYEGIMSRSYDAVRRDYMGRGYGEGGEVLQLEGGDAFYRQDFDQTFVNDLLTSSTSQEASIQQALRGVQQTPAPAGYRPGFDPEWNYFGNNPGWPPINQLTLPAPAAAPATTQADDPLQAHYDVLDGFIGAGTNEGLISANDYLTDNGLNASDYFERYGVDQAGYDEGLAQLIDNGQPSSNEADYIFTGENNDSGAPTNIPTYVAPAPAPAPAPVQTAPVQTAPAPVQTAQIQPSYIQPSYMDFVEPYYDPLGYGEGFGEFSYAHGGVIPGSGGGMDDGIAAMVNGSEPAALSAGEFVIPADVVSSLGDGNTEAGVKELYEMIDRVRQSKTGSTEQPPAVPLQMVMPA